MWLVCMWLFLGKGVVGVVDYAGLYPLPVENGACAHVSAVVATHDEGMFLEESLSSIAYCVGEVVVVDHGSTDETAGIIARVQTHFPNVVSARLSYEASTLRDAKNLGLLLGTREWQLRWDGDMIAYGREIVTSLCRFLAEREHGNVSGYAFAIPRVDGDLHHVYPLSVNGSGPEIYVFRRGALEFQPRGEYLDYPTMLGGDVGYIPRTLAGSNRGSFMLHLGTLKTAAKVRERMHMMSHQLYQNAARFRGKAILSYADWLFVRNNGRVPRSSEESGAYERMLTAKFCAEPRPLCVFDEDRWAHGVFVQTLLRNAALGGFAVRATNMCDPDWKCFGRCAPLYVISMPGC